MSGEAAGWVYRHSPFRGATFQIHHAIADSVNDLHDNLFWMARANLATKARVSGETVSDAVRALHEGGWIEPVDEGMDDPETRRRAGRPTRWRFLFPDVPVVYESRRRSREVAAQPLGTDPGGSGSADTQVAADPLGVAAPDTRNPRTTQDSTQASDELPLVPESGVDVPHETSDGSPRGDGRVEKVESRSEAGRALRATNRGGGRPRRTDPRADPLVKEWWEAQPSPPNQAWPAAVGVVSKALKNGVPEERLRRALRTLDSPLSGGRLDYALGQLAKSRRAEDQGTAEWRDAEPGEIVL